MVLSGYMLKQLFGSNGKAIVVTVWNIPSDRRQISVESLCRAASGRRGYQHDVNPGLTSMCVGAGGGGWRQQELAEKQPLVELREQVPHAQGQRAGPHVGQADIPGEAQAQGHLRQTDVLSRRGRSVSNN